MTNQVSLIRPYGGKLIDLMVPPEERAETASKASMLASVQLSSGSLCDLELLATGALSPLDRFMGEGDYRRVVEESRLDDGTLFPMPITLPVANAADVTIGEEVALRSANNDLIALMMIEEMFARDGTREMLRGYGSQNLCDPVIAEVQGAGEICISGRLRVIQLPKHFDFIELRRTPKEMRDLLAGLGRSRVVAFQTANIMHRFEEELSRRTAAAIDGTLLVQSVVGVRSEGEIDHYTRVRTHKVLFARYYDCHRAILNVLPLATRMAGLRKTLWHAIIQRNYGATHFITERDLQTPSGDSDSRDLLAGSEQELGVRFVPAPELVYLPAEERYEDRRKAAREAAVLSLSPGQVKSDYLRKGKPLPEWFTRPEIAAILAEHSPANQQRGFCVWFTGLSGAGKSTIAEILGVLLMEQGRRVTMLDGDVVRTHLSKGLGFSKEDRDANIRRIGFVAAEIVRHRGAIICAAVSPYRATRNECRAAIGTDQFIEIFVDTPLEICERRDAKGMYAKARRGEIKDFTGIDDPYEPPLQPELRLTTTDVAAEANAHKIFRFLIDRGFLPEP